MMASLGADAPVSLVLRQEVGGRLGAKCPPLVCIVIVIIFWPVLVSALWLNQDIGDRWRSLFL